MKISEETKGAFEQPFSFHEENFEIENEEGLFYIQKKNNVLSVKGTLELKDKVTLPPLYLEPITILNKGCSHHAKELIITDPISKLPEKFLKGNQTIRRINLKDTSIKEIPQFAFEKCFNLYTCILPKNLEVIRFEAFSESGLEEIEFPDSLVSIECFAFYHNRNLKRIKFGSEIKNIKSFSFLSVAPEEVIFPSPEMYTLLVGSGMCTKNIKDPILKLYLEQIIPEEN